MTLDEYNQIQNGMSYPQVVSIVGDTGLNTDDIPDFNGPEHPANVVSYLFFGQNSTAATVVFQDGVVIGKYQEGLI